MQSGLVIFGASHAAKRSGLSRRKSLNTKSSSKLAYLRPSLDSSSKYNTRIDYVQVHENPSVLRTWCRFTVAIASLRALRSGYRHKHKGLT